MRKEWRFTSYDRFCLKMVIRGAWFYAQAPGREHLEGALMELLRLYPQLSGRYQKKLDAVVYDDDKVRNFHPLEEVRLPGHSLEAFRPDGRRIYPLLRLLRPERFVRGEEDAFRVHLVHLHDADVLMVECAHCLMDGYSFHVLTTSLSALCRGLKAEAPRTSQGLVDSLWKDMSREEAIHQAKASSWTKLGFWDLSGMVLDIIRSRSIRDDLVLRFSKAEIDRDCQRFGAGYNAVLTARLLQVVAPVLPRGRRLSLAFTVNLRGKMEAISGDLTGNYSRMTALQGTVDGSLETGELARGIQAKLLNALEPAHLSQEIRLMGAASMHRLKYVNFDVPGMLRAKPRLLYINSQISLRLDEMDLGTGPVLLTAFNDLEDMVKLVREGDDYLILIHGDLAMLLKKARKES